jgi:hypothetical protein
LPEASLQGTGSLIELKSWVSQQNDDAVKQLGSPEVPFEGNGPDESSDNGVVLYVMVTSVVWSSQHTP